MKHISLDSVPSFKTEFGDGEKQIIIPPNTLSNFRQLGRVVFKKGLAVTPHSHPDFTEIMLVESGKGLMKVDENEFEVKSGDCIIVEINENHQITVTEEPFTLLFFGIYPK